MANPLVGRGSVVLVRYPFTDLSGLKVRPAIVLTPDSLLTILDDVTCLFISSVVPNKLLPTDMVLEMSHPSFSQTGLKYRSVLRAHKLAVLEKTLVLRKLGNVDKSLMNGVNEKLRLSLGLEQG